MNKLPAGTVIQLRMTIIEPITGANMEVGAQFTLLDPADADGLVALCTDQYPEIAQKGVNHYPAMINEVMGLIEPRGKA